jgi:hypothetical protein
MNTPTPPRDGAALMQMTVTGKAPLRMIDYSTAMQFCQE